ncbi:THAP domain-containing protein 2-like isoform X2 [Epargyreus clarus]|uniref:THAP domain-containing protein 2-like isoform X2 n=1 Tax=Epargyreus clarus TaxID=520877 RepID=UPI003C3045AB
MVTCAVPGCNSSKKENPQKYTFHIFPKSIDVRQKWLKMVDRKDWVPKRNSTICSKHFESKCFPYRGSQRKKLCSGSVPTLFMPVVLKPIRKASTYIYRNISPVPCTSADVP